MRLKFVISLGLIFTALIMSGCDKNDPRVCHQSLYIEFVNSAGENLVEKYGIEIDSAKTNIVTYFIKSDEYSITHKLNGEETAPRLPLQYNELYSPGQKRVEFGSSFDNYNLRNERKPYTYEYNFVCPKLFGNDQPRKISVVWGTKKKTFYNRILEIKFNGELIKHEDERDPKVTIVLQ